MCWLHVTAVLFMVRVLDAAGRSMCCCLVNKNQSSLTTVELAAVTTGQTSVDPLSK